MTRIYNRKALIYPDESYKIIGAVFDVDNELGYGYQEKYYYRAIKNKLIKLGFNVQSQVTAPLVASGQSIGRYFIDFLIEGKIVLEIKVANKVYPKHIKQVLGYLKANNLKLGIIATFTKDGVLFKRIVN